MTDIYNDGSYFKSNPSWHEEDSVWKFKQITMALERNFLNPGRVCEVGCGAGGILELMSEKYPLVEFTGFDVSKQACELSAKKTSSNLQFKQCDITKETVGEFDLAMVIDVIEHIEDYYLFLRKLRQVAEYKLFHIPLDLSVQTLLRSSPIVKVREQVGHIHYFTKETALASLEGVGYEIIDYFYTGSQLDLPNRGWRAGLLKYPRKAAFSLNKDLAVRVLGGYSLMVLAK